MSVECAIAHAQDHVARATLGRQLLDDILHAIARRRWYAALAEVCNEFLRREEPVDGPRRAVDRCFRQTDRMMTNSVGAVERLRVVLPGKSPAGWCWCAARIPR